MTSSLGQVPKLTQTGLGDGLVALEELAKKATPGPWMRSGVRQKITEDCIMVGRDGFLFLALPVGRNPKEHAGAFMDAAYIAACSPERILALVRVAKAAFGIGDGVLATEAEWKHIRDNPTFPGKPMVHVRLDFVEALHEALTSLTPTT